MTVQYAGLYSFPKSGNTWMREIIAALLFGDREDIPDMHEGPIHKAPTAIVQGSRTVRFYKSHRLSPLETTGGQAIDHFGFIYIVRHPLDVFLSYLNYLRVDSERLHVRAHVPYVSVGDLIKSGDIELFLDCFILYGTVQPDFVAPGSWFDNVRHWQTDVATPERPVIILKYEDMVRNAAGTYDALAAFLGVDADRIDTAVKKANQKTRIDGKFFWKQQPGLYKEMLPPALIRKFEKFHGETVRSLGYEL